jgi:hypothetical protein
MDFGGDDDILLQQQDEMEYVPKGQTGIGNAIKQAHADADAREVPTMPPPSRIYFVVLARMCTWRIV